jgi:hypothetical protein
VINTFVSKVIVLSLLYKLIKTPNKTCSIKITVFNINNVCSVLIHLWRTIILKMFIQAAVNYCNCISVTAVSVMAARHFSYLSLSHLH